MSVLGSLLLDRALLRLLLPPRRRVTTVLPTGKISTMWSWKRTHSQLLLGIFRGMGVLVALVVELEELRPSWMLVYF